jgi:hypothetical protein
MALLGHLTSNPYLHQILKTSTEATSTSIQTPFTTRTMASTTHPEFHFHTEALDVAKAFASGVKDKVVLVTGVNLQGIGYTAAQAFVSCPAPYCSIYPRAP